jgi:hypothetical protein
VRQHDKKIVPLGYDKLFRKQNGICDFVQYQTGDDKSDVP